MWLQALLTVDDISLGLAQVTPLRIALGDNNPDRYVWIAQPSSVSLVEDRGLRITTRARVQWDVVGIQVPVSLHAVSLMLIPSVVQQDGQDVLSFRAHVEGADIGSLPAMIEAPIIDRINAALDKPDAALTWRFMETLRFDFAMPALLQPLRETQLHARWGAVRVTAEGLSLAVAFGLRGAIDEASPFIAPPEVVTPRATSLDDTPPASA